MITHTPDQIGVSAAEFRLRPADMELTLLGVAVTACRFAFNVDRSFFNVSPDGFAALGVARWISGTGRWHMFDQATWRPGYSAILAPLFWFTNASEMLIKSALMVNAIVGGISAVVLVALAERLTDLSRRCALAVSALVALTPAALASSAYVWAESVVTLIFLLVCWWTLRFVETRNLRLGLAAVATALVGASVHGRLSALLMSTVIVVGGVMLAERRLRETFLVVAVAVVGTLTTLTVEREVVDRVWELPNATNTLRSTVARLDRPFAMLDTLLGQVWYQLAATASLAGVGAIVVARAALGSGRHAVDSRVIVALTAPMVLLSALFTAGRSRPDQFVYGRYNDAVVWPLIVVGAASLLRIARSRSTCDMRRIVLPATFATLALGLFVTLRRGSLLRTDRGLGPMIAGVLPVGGDSPGVDVARVTIVSLVVTALLILVISQVRTIRWLLPTVVVVLALVAGLRTHDALAVRLDGGEESAAAAVQIIELVPPGQTLGVRFVSDELQPVVSSAQQLAYALIYEWALPSYRFTADTPDNREATYVFAVVNEPVFSSSGGTVIWRDPQSQMVLWFDERKP